MKLKPFGGRVLESLLIVVAVGVAVAAVTVVANMMALTQRGTAQFNESLYMRQITLQAKADDYSAFYTGVVPTDVREIGPRGATPPKLGLPDLGAVKAAAPTVAYAYLEEFGAFSHSAVEEGESLWVSKVTADFQEAAGLQVRAGSLLSEADFSEQNRVILLGPRGVEKLKLTEPVVGQKVTFGDGEGTYTVVGVLEPTEAADEDDWYEAFVPWTPSEWSGISQLTFAVDHAANIPQAASEIRAYADVTWDGAMVVRSNRDMNRADMQGLRTRTLITAVFAALGLVTAALSIMSLMLARVLRRQREIGVRRSLGATRAAIRNQFLREALILGAVGGVLGVAAGYGLLELYAHYSESVWEGSSAFFTFSWPAAGASFGVALAVSALFGLYPAVLASRTRIVESLKEA